MRNSTGVFIVGCFFFVYFLFLSSSPTSYDSSEKRKEYEKSETFPKIQPKVEADILVRSARGNVSYSELDGKVYRKLGYEIVENATPVAVLRLQRPQTCEEVFTGWLRVADQKQPPKPPRKIPENFVDKFLLYGYASVNYAYHDDRDSPTGQKPTWWENMTTVMKKKPLELANMAYGIQALSVYHAMSSVGLRDQKGFVVGSMKPWVEAFALKAGAQHVLTVEYNKLNIEPTFRDSMSHIFPIDFCKDWSKYAQTFDFAASFSSIEHSGLGRYGDPVDPIGDLREMQKIHCMLKPGGLLFLGMPQGRDHITYNLHRIYGPIRLALMFTGFEWVSTFSGHQPEPIDVNFSTFNLNLGSFVQNTLMSSRLFSIIFFMFIVVLLLLTLTQRRFQDSDYIRRKLEQAKEKKEENSLTFEIIDDDTIRYKKPSKQRIAIVSVVEDKKHVETYDVAIKTMKCYAAIHEYNYILAVEKDFDCPHKDRFFRRHCVVAKILQGYDVVMFLDADIGVVFPKRRIEEYLDQNIDVTFYDRFYNWEIMAGSYIVKNTPFGRDLIAGFANFEYRMPNSFHGTDNGGLHLYLAQKLFPNEKNFISNCIRVYNKSKDFDDLFAYEACIRALFGAKSDFGKVRIMRKGTGWARDNWLTNSLWNKERDFMIHGWKKNQLQITPNEDVRIYESSRSAWYNPFLGDIDVTKCSPKNMTWSYDRRLLTHETRIQEKLDVFEAEVTRNQLKSLARVGNYLYPLVIGSFYSIFAFITNAENVEFRLNIHLNGYIKTKTRLLMYLKYLFFNSISGDENGRQGPVFAYFIKLFCRRIPILIVFTTSVYLYLIFTEIPRFIPESKSPLQEQTFAEPPKNRILTSHLYAVRFGGGLGNQLFELAALYGVAAYLNRIPTLDSSNPKLVRVLETMIKPNFPRFINLFRMVPAKEKRATKRELSNGHCCVFDDPSNLVTVRNHHLHLVGHYFQSFKYFDYRKDKLRKMLAPRREAEEKAERLLPDDRKNDTIVCVHIRRGDFLTDGMHAGTDGNFTKTATDYLVRKYHDRKRGRVTAVAMTNDIKWTNTLFNGTRTVNNPIKVNTPDLIEPYELYTSTLDAAGDLAFSAKFCNVFLITAPSSTFGWWLAYLSRPGADVYHRDISQTDDKVEILLLDRGRTDADGRSIQVYRGLHLRRISPRILAGCVFSRSHTFMSFRRRFQCTKISAACIIVPAFLLTLLFLRSNYQSEFDPDSILSTNEKDRIKGRIGYEVIGNNELFYNTTEKIAIVAVVENVDNISLYEFPIRTIQCYSKIQQYHYVLALASDFDCNMKDISVNPNEFTSIYNLK
ncbi:unnamed protein product [Caenorhabditis auriculariae]|uniref:L-Fucosyltransferase n=1 Tax=Caenorhabditis auriculariae TaxID=2777116 RepID=A0A8S1GVF3_9PELO|nr:unnamed protein product [Caenorhabditis auriculariae]